MANDKKDREDSKRKKSPIPVRPTELFRSVPVPKPLKDSGEAADRLAEQVRRDRRSPRVTIRPAEARLLYRFLRRRDSTRIGPTYEGMIFDISSSGVKFRGFLPEGVSEESLSDGEVLIGMNIFFLSVDEPLKALGRAAWIKGTKKEHEYEIGVEFLTQAEDAEQVLKAYLINTGTRRRR